MAIENVIIHVENVPRAVAFYSRYLAGQPLGETTSERAVLDFVTGTIEFLRLDGGDPPIWVEDDAYRGFRHVGFKVDHVDTFVETLRAGDVQFRMGPLDAVGDVRIVFFFDPDGTVLELVEGNCNTTRCRMRTW